MKAGVRFSLTTRAKENTTSSARTGLPEWNLAPSRMVKVMVFAAASTVHSLARPGRQHRRVLGVVLHQPVVDVGDELARR